MTNEERANLAGRLRVSLAHHTAAPSVVFAGSKDITQAADQIEADGKRIAELTAALQLLHDNIVHAWPAVADLGPVASARAALGEGE